MRHPVRAIFSSLIGCLCWHSANARADDPFADEASVAVRTTLVEDVSTVEFACRKQAFYARNANGLKACQGTDAALWAAEAQAFVSSAGEYLGAAEQPAIGACVPQPALTFAIERQAVATADADLVNAKLQLAAANAANTSAREEAVEAAQANLDDKKRILRQAALTAAKQKHVAWREAVTKHRARGQLYDFEQIAEGAIRLPAQDAPGVPASGLSSPAQARAAACIELYQARRAALAPQQDAADERKIDLTARLTHEVDTLRKTSPAPSLATAAAGGVESPGAPDYVVYSVLSALGADEETTGTQLALTLNVSSLIWPETEDRLKQPVAYRNVFLRGAFPLDITQRDATPPEPPSDDVTAGEAVRRFSMVVGGSLIDENDTRTDGNRRCYEAALAYADYGLTPESNLSTTIERQAYFDVCNREIVNRMRVAWRAGVGFVSEAGAGSESADTKPEMYGGVVIWAPTSQINLNLLYQRYLRPRTVHTVGGGVSVAGNAGGGLSGADGWARIGIDTTLLLSHQPDADETSWQLRLAPTIRGRFIGDGVASVALGPVIRSEGDPALLATITFGYDADRIMNQLLTPLPQAAATAEPPP